MRHVLCLEYDGRGFCGFQSQPSRCSVQDVLEHALAAIAGSAVRVTACGRTDAGVHATAQVVHFDSDAVRPETAWVRGVNAHLPAAASVLWSRPCADDFHARFAARARHYTYLLLDRGSRPGLDAGRVGWYHGPLDPASMHAAARCLVGTHDFSAFRAAECQAKTPIRQMIALDVSRAGPYVRFDLTANAFLHHMVRNIVGALVYVGAGRQPVAWIAELLAGRDRTRAAPTFAPDGLYFTGAQYDARFGLPAVRRPLAAPQDLPCAPA